MHASFDSGWRPITPISIPNKDFLKWIRFRKGLVGKKALLDFHFYIFPVWWIKRHVSLTFSAACLRCIRGYCFFVGQFVIVTTFVKCVLVHAFGFVRIFFVRQYFPQMLVDRFTDISWNNGGWFVFSCTYNGLFPSWRNHETRSDSQIYLSQIAVTIFRQAKCFLGMSHMLDVWRVWSS